MFWRTTTLLTVGAVGSVLGMWAADRDAPIDIVQAEVLTPVVKPGGEFCLQYEVVRRGSCRTRLQRILYDGTRERYVLPDVDLWAAAGPQGRDHYKTCAPVPAKFAPGAASYRQMTEYACNPLHNIWPIVHVADELHFRSEGQPDASSPIEVVPRR
jgi:hypothetical protein